MFFFQAEDGIRYQIFFSHSGKAKCEPIETRPAAAKTGRSNELVLVANGPHRMTPEYRPAPAETASELAGPTGTVALDQFAPLELRLHSGVIYASASPPGCLQ